MKKSKTLIIYTSIIMIFVIAITIGFSAFNFNLLIDGIALDVRADEKLRITSFNPVSSSNNGVAKAEDYNVNNVYMDISLPNKTSKITYEIKLRNYGNVEMGISDIILPDELKNILNVSTEGYTLGYKIKDDEDSCQINECKLTIEKTFNITIGYNSSHTVTETDFNNVLLEFLFNRAYNVTLNNFEDIAYNPNALQNSNYSIELGDALFEVTMDESPVADYSYTNGTLTINNVSGDIVITKILKVDFSYDLDGGTLTQQLDDSYKPGTTIELEEPTKDGYAFTGWVLTSDSGILSGNTLTIGNEATSVKATWISTSPINSYSCSNSSAGTEPYLFAYTGECEVIDDGNGDWRMKLLSDGDFLSNSNVLADLFLVGGGGGGGNGGNSDGGGGGGGGYANTGIVNIIRGQSYEIVVGEGGESESAGEASKAFGAIANGGCGGSGNTGGCGGSGGGSGASSNTYSGSAGGSNGSDGKYSRNYSGPGQQMSTREFGETTGTLYAGGGGGGGGYNTSTGNFSTGASGGDGGGVTGGTSNPAANNTGGGGGGGQAGPWRTNGTAGGSGIVIIRNARTATNIELKYDYTGYHIYSLDSNGKWKIKFFTSGTFTPHDNVITTAFLLGGGGGGGDGGREDGGGGGGGGYTTTRIVSLEKNKSYAIVIGEGGANAVAGTASTAFDLEAAGGLPGDSSANPGAGGSGGGSGGHSNNYTGRAGGSDGSTGGGGYRTGGTGQGKSTREFGEATAVLYAGGGGGGGGYSYTNGNFSLPGYFGSGGAVAGNSASPAAPNFGGGGGGGQAGPWKTNGSAGGSGIVVIRGMSEEETQDKNLVQYINSLYNNAEKSTVTRNSVTYNYATSVGLMNDRLGSNSNDINGGNIRYYGANPNNYIYFNCSDYSKPSASTCEVWRIIGVFDGKVKIMRTSSIGSYSFDSHSSGYAAIYSSASLMYLLNPGYEEGASDYGFEGSLYWNAKSGTCYSGQNGASKDCNFTTNGLKNNVTRNLISKTTWVMERGGASYYADAAYTNGISSKYGNWDGWVGMPAISDYAYATDLSLCTTHSAAYKNIANCYNNDWMYGIMNAANTWFFTAYISLTGQVMYKQTGENLNRDYAYASYNVIPSVYLDPAAIISFSNDGSSTDPYRLVVSDASYEDVKPVCTISYTENSTTLTASYSDNDGVVGYYFGTTLPTSSTTFTPISSSLSGTQTGIVDSTGTYYFGFKDISGNIGVCSGVSTSTKDDCSSGFPQNGACYQNIVQNGQWVGTQYLHEFDKKTCETSETKLSDSYCFIEN